MGKVKTTWLAPGHSGSPCNHDSIYTKTDLRAGLGLLRNRAARISA